LEGEENGFYLRFLHVFFGGYSVGGGDNVVVAGIFEGAFVSANGEGFEVEADVVYGLEESSSLRGILFSGGGGGGGDFGVYGCF